MNLSLSRISAIMLRQYYLMRGSMSRVLPLFTWVAIDMLLWGFIAKHLDTVAMPGYDFIPALLGAVVLWDFFSRVMYGVTMAFFEDVWSRNFLNMFASPLSISEYLAGLVLTSILTSFLGLVVMLLLATTMFGLSVFSFGLAIFPFLLVLFLFGIALGIVGTSIVLRFGPAAEWFIWPIPALVSPFVGVFYPITTLPQPLQYFAYVLPPTYVFEGMRAIVSGGQASPLGLVASFFLAIGYIGLACWFFNRTFRRAVRTGLLARYSAETVS
jgi:ABC-2 type transport system permease protein